MAFKAPTASLLAFKAAAHLAFHWGSCFLRARHQEKNSRRTTAKAKVRRARLREVAVPRATLPPWDSHSITTLNTPVHAVSSSSALEMCVFHTSMPLKGRKAMVSTARPSAAAEAMPCVAAKGGRAEVREENPALAARRATRAWLRGRKYARPGAMEVSSAACARASRRGAGVVAAAAAAAVAAVVVMEALERGEEVLPSLQHSGQRAFTFPMDPSPPPPALQQLTLPDLHCA